MNTIGINLNVFIKKCITYIYFTYNKYMNFKYPFKRITSCW